MQRKLFVSLFLIVLVALSAACQPVQPVEPAPAAAPEVPVPGGENRIVLATTTSTRDSGLLDVILPMFEEEYGIDVDVVAVGTGQIRSSWARTATPMVLVHAARWKTPSWKPGAASAMRP